MAIRYSGDVEVRIARTGERCRVAVRWPNGRGGIARYAQTVSAPRGSRESVEDYHDRVALGVLRALAARVRGLPVERSWVGISVRRVFQAPCPTS